MRYRFPRWTFWLCLADDSSLPDGNDSENQSGSGKDSGGKSDSIYCGRLFGGGDLFQIDGFTVVAVNIGNHIALDQKIWIL